MSERQYPAGALRKFAEQARRRLVVFRIVEGFCLGLAVALGLLAVLVVLRVQVLNAPILTLLALIVAVGGTARVAHRFPTVREVSRLIDRKCGLSDALSTALHFQDSPAEVARLQRIQAQTAIQAVDLPSALPFHLGRSAFFLAATAVLAALLGFQRYGVEHRLLLANPRPSAPQDVLGMVVEADTEARRRLEPKSEERATPPASGVPLPAASSPTSAEASSVQHSGQSVGASTAQQTPNGEQSAGAMKSEEAAASSPRAGTQSGPGSQEGPPQSAPKNAKQSSSPGSSGALSKLRDAVSSLVAKMRPGGEPPPAGSQSAPQANSKQPSGQPNGGKNSPGGENAEPKEGGDQSASQDADKPAGGKGQGKGADQSASAKPGSGVGKQDGSKELRDAERQAAMGKLSDVIGKRSASVSGEMSIEPQSGPQQLRTAYSNSSAKHKAGGGDVNREDIPIALQPYVQAYFLQVHKQSAAKTARAGKPEPHQ